MQEINLYLLLPKRTGFSLLDRSTVIYGLLAMLLMIVYYGYTFIGKKHLDAQLIVFKDENAQLQNQLNILLQKYPVGDPAELKKSIQDLQKSLTDKTTGLNLLLPYNNYSEFLLGLANSIVPGIWFTEIIFARGPDNIGIRGYAVETKLLDNLLPEMEKQSVFSPYNFTLKEVSEEKLPASFHIVSKKDIE